MYINTSDQKEQNKKNKKNADYKICSNFQF